MKLAHLFIGLILASIFLSSCKKDSLPLLPLDQKIEMNFDEKVALKEGELNIHFVEVSPGIQCTFPPCLGEAIVLNLMSSDTSFKVFLNLLDDPFLSTAKIDDFSIELLEVRTHEEKSKYNIALQITED